MTLGELNNLSIEHVTFMGFSPIKFNIKIKSGPKCKAFHNIRVFISVQVNACITKIKCTLHDFQNVKYYLKIVVL